jgi:hypothetical protein
VNLLFGIEYLENVDQTRGASYGAPQVAHFKRAVSDPELALLQDAKAHSGSQNVADARWRGSDAQRSEMPKRG